MWNNLNYFIKSINLYLFWFGFNLVNKIRTKHVDINNLPHIIFLNPFGDNIDLNNQLANMGYPNQIKALLNSNRKILKI